MKKSNKKKGASLIIVLMVLAIAMILSSVTLTTISRTTKANASEKKSEDLLYSAESGLQYGLAWFNKFSEDKTKNLNMYLNSKSTNEAGQKYDVIYTDIINSLNTEIKITEIVANKEYKLESTSNMANGNKRTVSAKINMSIVEVPGEGGGDTDPFGGKNPALIVPALPNISFNQGGNNNNYYIDNAFMYDKEQFYDYLKTVRQNSIQNFQYPVPVYLKNPGIVIPTIGYTVPTVNVDFTKNYQRTGSGNGKRTVGRTIYEGSYEVGTEGEYTVYYYNGNLNIYPIDNNNDNVDQDLSKVKIYVLGTTTIRADKVININNMSLITNYLNVYSQNRGIEINNSNILTKNATISAQGGDVNLLNSKIIAENISIQNQNNRIKIYNSEIVAKNDANISANNIDTTIEKTKINANNVNITNQNQKINIIGSSEIFSSKVVITTQNENIRVEDSKIQSLEIKTNSKNKKTIFINSSLLSNSMIIETEGGGEYTSSDIISGSIGVYLKNSSSNKFENSIVITKSLNFPNSIDGNETVKFIISDETAYKSSLKRATNYLKLNTGGSVVKQPQYSFGEIEYLK